MLLQLVEACVVVEVFYVEETIGVLDSATGTAQVYRGKELFETADLG